MSAQLFRFFHEEGKLYGASRVGPHRTMSFVGLLLRAVLALFPHSVGMRSRFSSSSLRARRVNVVDRFRRVHFRMNQTTASTNVNRPARVKSFDRIKNTTEEYQALRPSIQQLRMVAFQAGVPFIGFGFVDNLIMILAGDYIDVTFA